MKQSPGPSEFSVFEVFVVFASGIPVAGGPVGYANIILHDSPPLTGWPLSSVDYFEQVTDIRYTPVYQAKQGFSIPSRVR